jgi:hypothetical protein
MQRQRNQRDKVPRGALGTIALGVLLPLLLALAPLTRASQTSGTIDSAYKYAWSSVGGWVNLAPTNGGLTITDTAITGYAWSANTGWLNFDTAQSGVTNNAEGTLGGFAWDAGGGWLSFTGVTIDSSGRFHGTATGGTVNGASYTLTFDCANCDVRTDWRPASSRTSSSGSNSATSGSGGGCSPDFFVWDPATKRCIFANEATSSPTIITDVPTIFPSGMSPSVPSPSRTVPNVFGENNPVVTTPVSPPASLKKATASSTRSATTTVRVGKGVVASVVNFFRSVAQGIFGGLRAFFRFFWRF